MLPIGLFRPVSRTFLGPIFRPIYGLFRTKFSAFHELFGPFHWHREPSPTSEASSVRLFIFWPSGGRRSDLFRPFLKRSGIEVLLEDGRSLGLLKVFGFLPVGTKGLGQLLSNHRLKPTSEALLLRTSGLYPDPQRSTVGDIEADVEPTSRPTSRRQQGHKLPQVVVFLFLRLTLII